jgi:succinyl-CoA synthetase beta subunit
MARRKLSEVRAKSILYEALGVKYPGLSVDVQVDTDTQLAELEPGTRYVVKVDQGVKGRFKKGLVKVDRAPIEVRGDLKEMAALGYRYFIVEPYKHHAPGDERYLSIEVGRDGDELTYTQHGGVDVESHANSMQHAALTAEAAAVADAALGLPDGTVGALAGACERSHLSFLEINPLVVLDGRPLLLDAAVEVDAVAEPMVRGAWTQYDLRESRNLTSYEETIEALADQSQASFKLDVLNPDGSVFMLLSGGGASVTLADEVHNQGYGKELGNYGEYSGNPNEEETMLYARQVLKLMLSSKSPRKVLVISGGVANFTDVRVTFRGVVRALDEVKEKMRAQHIKVYVRRGGPYEVQGLAMMQRFLEAEQLLGIVAGPDMALSEIVPLALAGMEAGA